MLLGEGNPYWFGLPDELKLVRADFESGLSPVNAAAVGRTAAWTVMVYMAADCNLAAYQFDDLMDLKRVGSSDDVHVCVFFDGPWLADAFFARLNRDTPLAADILFRFLDVYSHKPQ